MMLKIRPQSCKAYKYCLAGMLLIASTQTFAKCNQEEADKGIQSEMNICAYEAYEKADKKLNAAYKNVIADLNSINDNNKTYRDKRLQALKSAQKNWLKFRDLECEYQGLEYDGGSIQHLIEAICLEQLTKERTRQLKVEPK